MTPPARAPGAAPQGATLAEVGEFALIAMLTGRLEQHQNVYIGPGDDAAVLRTPKGHVVVSTDLSVENHHFRREWAQASDVGHKAAAANLSDINAMGGRATALTVGLAVPATLPVQWVLDLADGIAAEAALVGASVIGGDLTSAEEIMIAITVLGECQVAPVRRSGAGIGDVLAIAGRQGWAAGGLAVLRRGFGSPRKLVQAFQRPSPPYDAGLLAAQTGATSMIDVSDGLVADVGHLAEDSGVAIDLRRAAFEIDEPLQALGAALGVDPIDFILGGGEDHPIVATFPEGTELPAGFRAIGSVVGSAGPGPTGKGEPQVTVDGVAYEGTAGHTHF